MSKTLTCRLLGEICRKSFSFEELDFFCLTGMRPIGNMLGLLSYKGAGDEGTLYLN